MQGRVEIFLVASWYRNPNKLRSELINLELFLVRYKMCKWVVSD